MDSNKGLKKVVSHEYAVSVTAKRFSPCNLRLRRRSPKPSTLLADLLAVLAILAVLCILACLRDRIGIAADCRIVERPWRHVARRTRRFVRYRPAIAFGTSSVGCVRQPAATLALAGVMMQALLRNALADPYVLGVSGGASVVGLLAAMLLFSAAWWSDRYRSICRSHCRSPAAVPAGIS